MKSFSNTYIFIFSAVMVIIVATLLSFVAMQLKPRQELNVKTEKMQNILKSVRIESTKKNAEDLYGKYVTDSYVIDPSAEVLEGVAPLEVDLKKEVSKIDKIQNLRASLQEKRESPFKTFLSGIIQFKRVDRSQIQQRIQEVASRRKLPVYEVEKETETFYVIPLQGKGLWGPISGFVSLEDDMNTVYGAVFDHKSETPGLGAEITEDWFEDDFVGKKLFEDGEFRSIDVIKGGTPEDNPHGVDAISGGTITSKGVEAMLHDGMAGYITFFKNKRN